MDPPITIFLADYQDGRTPTPSKVLPDSCEPVWAAILMARWSQIDPSNNSSRIQSAAWPRETSSLPQGVLHFKRCWDDPTIQDLYKDKFIYIADLIVQYILTPRNITQTCTVLSSNALIRATIEIPEDRTTAYAKFRAADETLWTDADGPGNEGILWVQESATPSTSVKTLKYYTTSQLRGTVNMTI
ncbi:hypothetical protein HBI92_125600 [Parastagonospora nodorum]|nr:hypothetical protein HBI97_163500 [Parastagonospora nodorum]KAH5801183.1 hypothetical protein HBI96_148710 [Parastagonospora nodorum]KAH5862469.1 hypothetical protein HBI91_124420 [Parastagonospora nodorum]KAH5863573.1 hypothetical protein HBI90_139560 [Parastagonospora nodorum]KAH5887226.1 hypothetical protein HBI92_125600 [Parastagonospora nodorum]